EVDICDIAMKEVTSQFFDHLLNVDAGAEFLSIASTLLLMKSRKLLPNEAKIDEDPDPRFEIIHKLLEYCRFKEVAKELSSLEQERKALFPRDVSPPSKERGDGLEEIQLQDLTQLLHSVLEQAAKRPKAIIKEEEWQIGPKIEWLEAELEKGEKIAFETVFDPEKSRQELIVSFLALLELMKLQKASVVKENENIYIIKSYESKS
nr:Segregation and condensation protein A [Chlamydiota bacterium]